MAKYVLVVWFALSIVYVSLLIQYQRVNISKELVASTNSLVNVASQRANQHDAHLTGLAAVALAGEQPDSSLFMEVVAALVQFYPRVTAIDLISLASDEIRSF